MPSGITLSLSMAKSWNFLSNHVGYSSLSFLTFTECLVLHALCTGFLFSVSVTVYNWQHLKAIKCVSALVCAY